MKSEEHITIGLIVGGILGLVVRSIVGSITIPNFIIITIFGGFGASIPDTMEPATSWRHRKGYHSYRTLQRLSIILIIMLISSPFWDGEPFGYVITGTVGGYISHLLLDATTPMGLPS